MIAVNLLPVEMRRLESTPLPRRLVIFGSVAINFIGLLVLLSMHLFSIPNAESVQQRYNQRIYQLKNIQKIGQEHATLVAALNDFETRKTTINHIEQARVIWAKKLDQLWDLTPQTIWFQSIELQEPEKPVARRRGEAAAAPEGSRLIITGFYSSGTSIDELSRFIASLQREAEEEGQEVFFDGFERIEDPVLEKDVKTFKEYDNAVVTKFELTLVMKPRSTQQAPATAARPASRRS